MAEQSQTEARVGEIRAAIDRKTIRAPFAGILGIRQVNLGQYLAAGEPLVGLQSLNPDLREVRRATAGGRPDAPGRSVRIVSGQPPAGCLHRPHHRHDSIVNEATRNVQVQATLDNPDGRLRPACSCRPK